MKKTFNITVDGYNVGERLLEGVDFICDIEVTDEPEPALSILKVEVDPAAKKYFEQLNSEYWYDAVKDSLDVWTLIEDEYLSDQDALEIANVFGIELET